LRRVRRLMASGTGATRPAIRQQLLQSVIRSQRVTGSAIQTTVRTLQRQAIAVTGNEALAERLLRVTRDASQLHAIPVRIAVTRRAIARQTQEALLTFGQDVDLGMFVTLGAVEFAVG